jgi:hypothetical protein
LENGYPLADNGEKFALATVYARDIKTHLEYAIIVPNSIALVEAKCEVFFEIMVLNTYNAPSRYSFHNRYREPKRRGVLGGLSIQGIFDLPESIY